MAEMQIQIGADVNGAIRGLQQVETQTQKTFSKVASTSNQAGTAVGNLSRIVQDAPFGFIAISNNLQPLFDDFNRLKSQTGSVGGAFKSLIGAIAGPAGIGLAFAAATSLVTYFSKEIFGSGAAAKKAKSDVDEFNKSLNSAKASALSTGLQLQSFVDIAKNTELPLKQRNQALNEANEILGQYGKTLTLTNIATQEATNLVNEYTKGLVAQALAGQYADRIASLLIKQSEAQESVTKAQIEFNKAQQALANRPNLSVREQELGRGLTFITQRDNALKKLNQSQEDYNQLTKTIAETTAKFNQQALESSKFLGEVGKKPVKVKAEVEFDEIKALESSLAKFQKFLLSDKASDKLKLRIAISGVTIEPKPSFYQQLQTQTVEAIQKARPEAFKPPEIKLPFEVTPESVEFGKGLVKLIDEINTAIEGIQVQGLASIGEAIGQAISGGDVKNVFQSFIDTISSAVTAIGKQMIALGIKAALLKKALSTLFSNPIALVAAGVGLIAVGTAIRGALSRGIEGREKGGPVTGNTPYIVGERGPELFVPSVGGSIIPNNQLSSFNGRPAFATAMGGRSIVRGNDILLTYARTQRSQSRVNG